MNTIKSLHGALRGIQFGFNFRDNLKYFWDLFEMDFLGNFVTFLWRAYVGSKQMSANVEVKFNICDKLAQHILIQFFTISS